MHLTILVEAKFSLFRPSKRNKNNSNFSFVLDKGLEEGNVMNMLQ